VIKMAKIEREYNIPLRKEFLKVPGYKRSKKAITAIKEFLMKHMKSENVNLGNHLNELVWKDGIKNPPHHVSVKVTKDDEGKVFAELKELPKAKKSSIEKKREAKEKKKEASKKKLDAVKEAVQKAKETPKEKPKKEAPKTEATPKEEAEVPKKEAKTEAKE
jgi:large subunit ribosomal protein L31e